MRYELIEKRFLSTKISKLPSLIFLNFQIIAAESSQQIPDRIEKVVVINSDGNIVDESILNPHVMLQSYPEIIH